MSGLKKSAIAASVLFGLLPASEGDAADSKMLPGSICQPSYFGWDISRLSVNTSAIINYGYSNVDVVCPIVRDNTGSGEILDRIEVMALPNTSCYVYVSDQTSLLSSNGYAKKSVASSKPFGAYKLTWLASELPSNLSKNAVMLGCELAANPTNPGSAGGGIKNIFYTEP